MVLQSTAKAKGSLPLLGSCSSNTSHPCVHGFKTFPTWQCQRLYQMDLSNTSARPPGKDPALPRSFSTLNRPFPAFSGADPSSQFQPLGTCIGLSRFAPPHPNLALPVLYRHLSAQLEATEDGFTGTAWGDPAVLLDWGSTRSQLLQAWFAVLSSLMGTKQRGKGEAAMHQCPGQGSPLGGGSASNWVKIVLGSHPRLSAQEHKAHRPSLVSSDGRAPPPPLAAFSRKQRLRDGCGWILPEI